MPFMNIIDDWLLWIYETYDRIRKTNKARRQKQPCSVVTSALRSLAKSGSKSGSKTCSKIFAGLVLEPLSGSKKLRSGVKKITPRGE